MSKPGDIVQYTSGNIGIVTADGTVVKIKSVTAEDTLVEHSDLNGNTTKPPLFNLVELIDKILPENADKI